MLKQYLREAELELIRKRARIDTLADEEKRLGDEIGRCAEELRALDADVGLALDGGKEDLARFALRRLLTLRTREGALRIDIGARVAERESLEQRLGDQEQRFEALRTRVRAELTRPEPEAGRDPGDDGLGEPAIADEQVELELMRRMSEREAS